MKTAIINGKIYLGQGSFAQALLIENGHVIKAGKTDAILNEASADTIVFDIEGKTVLPGFHDSHMHLLGIAKKLRSIDLRGCTSQAELITRCKSYASEHPNDTFLVARGWDQELFTDVPSIPDRGLLDQVTTERPIIASRICGHILSCNTRALELAKITACTHVDGGEVCLGPDGNPNGVLCERAVRLLWDLEPEPTRDVQEDTLLRAMHEAVAEGLTTIQTNDIREENYEAVYSVYHDLFAKKLPPLRVVHQVRFSNVKNLHTFLTQYKSCGFDGEFHRFGSIKLMADGSLGSRTALLHEGYADAPDVKGISWLSQAEMDAMFSLCQKAGLPAIIHAIGDEAINMALNSIEKACVGGKNIYRHGIVHCQITDAWLLDRIKKLDVQVFLQPIFLNSDYPIIRTRVGEKLEKTSYAFGTLTKNRDTCVLRNGCARGKLSSFR